MKLLAFDTAGKSCSVALTAGGKLVAEATATEKGTHTRRLMPMIAAVLKRARLELDAVDGFAATVGPGSFTGLRIGLSTLKGLAAATGKPVAGVSALEALAHQCSVQAKYVTSMLDARKGEVYYCRYRRTRESLLALTGEKIDAPAAAAAEADLPCAFVGDGALGYRGIIGSVAGERALIAPSAENVIRAGTVAKIGFRRLVRGDSDDPSGITPHYIRKSDAENALR